MPKERKQKKKSYIEDKSEIPSTNIHTKTISLPNKNRSHLNQKNKDKGRKSKLSQNLNLSKRRISALQSSIIEFNPQIYKFYINNPDRNVIELKYKDNTINTRKYNIITFLPKSLLLQFMRFANIYFLIIAIIQCLPIISPLGATTAILPLVFVLTVSIIREGYEDCQRAKIDKEQNCEISEVFRNGKWVKIKSGDLKMGEIVSVKKDCTFPADLVLIDID